RSTIRVTLPCHRENEISHLSAGEVTLRESLVQAHWRLTKTRVIPEPMNSLVSAMVIQIPSTCYLRAVSYRLRYTQGGYQRNYTSLHRGKRSLARSVTVVSRWLSDSNAFATSSYHQYSAPLRCPVSNNKTQVPTDHMINETRVRPPHSSMHPDSK